MSRHLVQHLARTFVLTKSGKSQYKNLTLISFQSIPSQGKPLVEYVDGKSSSPSIMESIVHQPPKELQKKSLEVDVARAPLLQIQLLSNDNNISKKSDNDVIKYEDGNPEIMEKKITLHKIPLLPMIGPC